MFSVSLCITIFLSLCMSYLTLSVFLKGGREKIKEGSRESDVVE